MHQCIRHKKFNLQINLQWTWNLNSKSIWGRMITFLSLSALQAKLAYFHSNWKASVKTRSDYWEKKQYIIFSTDRDLPLKQKCQKHFSQVSLPLFASGGCTREIQFAIGCINSFCSQLLRQLILLTQYLFHSKLWNSWPSY